MASDFSRNGESENNRKNVGKSKDLRKTLKYDFTKERRDKDVYKSKLFDCLSKARESHSVTP